MKKYMSTGYAWIPDNENTAKTQRFRSGLFVPTNAELNILHFLFMTPHTIQPNTDFSHLLSNIIESIACGVGAGKRLGNQRIDVSHNVKPP